MNYHGMDLAVAKLSQSQVSALGYCAGNGRIRSIIDDAQKVFFCTDNERISSLIVISKDNYVNDLMLGDRLALLTRRPLINSDKDTAIWRNYPTQGVPVLPDDIFALVEQVIRNNAVMYY